MCGRFRDLYTIECWQGKRVPKSWKCHWRRMHVHCMPQMNIFRLQTHILNCAWDVFGGCWGVFETIPPAHEIHEGEGTPSQPFTLDDFGKGSNMCDTEIRPTQELGSTWTSSHLSVYCYHVGDSWLLIDGRTKQHCILRNMDEAFKRGSTRKWTIYGPHVTWTSPIWLKIAISAGNDPKPNLKVEFWTFISKNIEKMTKILIFWKIMKNAFPNLPNPRMVLEKNGKTNFGSYGPKDFAEKGIFGISQGTQVLRPAKGWARSRPSNFSPCS